MIPLDSRMCATSLPCCRHKKTKSSSEEAVVAAMTNIVGLQDVRNLLALKEKNKRRRDHNRHKCKTAAAGDMDDCSTPSCCQPSCSTPCCSWAITGCLASAAAPHTGPTYKEDHNHDRLRTCSIPRSSSAVTRLAHASTKQQPTCTQPLADTYINTNSKASPPAARHAPAVQ
jgi:hypothetical protein